MLIVINSRVRYDPFSNAVITNPEQIEAPKIPRLSPKEKTIMERLNENYKLAHTLDIDVLERILAESEVAYYNEIADPSAILLDEVYDYAKEVYKTRIAETGVAPKEEEEIEKEPTGMEHVPQPIGRLQKLPVWMGSATKVNHGSGQLELWKSRYEGPYMLSAKMDGASALYFRDGNEYKMYSRGNGAEGQNISEFLDYLQLPDLPSDVLIRGELIIRKSLFEEKYKKRNDPSDPSDVDRFKNSRNAVAGLVNRVGANAAKGVVTPFSSLQREFMNDIDFIVYEVIATPPFSCVDQYNILVEMFPNTTARHEVLNTISDDILSKVYDTYLEEMNYEIDGIIICAAGIHERPYGKNPDYMRAYKKPLAILTAITTVHEVEWNVSKDLYYKPVVIFDPIELDGVTITRATGYNARFIVDNQIGPRAKIEITRSGGVIPKIIKVVEPAEQLQLPSKEYKWNQRKVEFVAIFKEEEPREVTIKKMYHFLTTIGTKGIGEKTVARIYDTGLATSIIEIFVLDADLLGEEFGPKQSKNFAKTINDSIQSMNLPILAAASQIFGRAAGRRRFIAIFNAYPDLLQRQEVKDMDIEAITRLIMKLEGFARITSEQIASNMPEFIDFLEELKEDHDYEPPPYVPPVKSSGRRITDTGEEEYEEHELSGKNVLLTGFRDAKIKLFIESVGGNVQSGISGKTNLLIIKEPGIVNAKTKRAERDNIPIITRDDFIAQYMS